MFERFKLAQENIVVASCEHSSERSGCTNKRNLLTNRGNVTFSRKRQTDTGMYS
jgi:hypothetical protein